MLFSFYHISFYLLDTQFKFSIPKEGLGNDNLIYLKKGYFSSAMSLWFQIHGTFFVRHVIILCFGYQFITDAQIHVYVHMLYLNWELFVCSYVPNPVLVIIDVQPKELGIPTKAYYAIEEVKEVWSISAWSRINILSALFHLETQPSNRWIF